MKHDLEAFSRDIVTLIKTSGDTGGSGDKSKKSLGERDNSVPTRCAEVSPLNSHWGHAVAASGDRTSERLQLLVADVPSVPTATTQFEQGRALALGSETPSEWHAILVGLERREPIDCFGAERWDDLLSDAEGFLSRWGGVAYSLGWTSLDMFGVHPIAPAVGFDVMGLIPMLNRAVVLALTSQTATMRKPLGALLTYRRPGRRDAILLSDI